MHREPNSRLTAVEQTALRGSAFEALYPPTEKIKTIVVDNFPALGRLTAMRFIEWVQANPGGAVALPTGKTPEHFIGTIGRLLQTWDTPETQAELTAAGVDPGRRPDMRSLRFVQIDEFYPMDPAQENSFHHYVRRFYIGGFGLDPARAMLMDCSKIGLVPGQMMREVWPDGRVDLGLRYRAAQTPLERVQKDVLERVDQWCQEYEDRVRALGGIGFFLGGIGPDGHVGFNVRGSDHHSTTRLSATNYPTQAAAAVDLGGIEIARHRLVITIGLGTITFSPQCTAVITASGAAKAQVVADAVQGEPSVLHPATALHALPNAAFYVTSGAAGGLRERQQSLLARQGRAGEEDAAKAVVNLALSRRKRLADLGAEDFRADRLASAVLERRPGGLKELVGGVRDLLIRRIERGSQTLTSTRFLHTEPHHDDIMLGYLPYVVRHVRHPSNTHYFASLTSGFTSVTNAFMLGLLAQVGRFLDTRHFAELMAEGYFEPANRIARNRDIWQCLDGVAIGRDAVRDEGTSRRLVRCLIEVFGDREPSALRRRVAGLRRYFETQYPGGRDPETVQRLKGMCREWEVECLWGYFGWNSENVRHLRLGFYTGEIFTEEPSVERDVAPVLALLEEVRPDVVSVALDPEGSGPDTHYKVLQAVTEALRRYEAATGRSDIKVWGYRNVWFRFHPAEADIFVPVSLNMFAVTASAFMNTFASQRDASFPSYEHDGPFSELAQQIQVEQYQMLKTCLGRQWFQEHPSALIRATRGLVFLKEMSLQQLYAHSRALRHTAENR